MAAQGEQDRPIGFAGLEAFATPVEQAIQRAERIAAGPPPAPALVEPPAQPERGPPIATHRDLGGLGKAAAGLKSLGVIAGGIILIVIIKGGLAGLFHSGSSSSSTYTPPPAEYSAPDYSPGEVASGGSGAAAPEIEVNGSADTTSIEAPAPNSDTIGRTMPELRYCLAAKIKLEAGDARAEELKLSDPSAFDRAVEPFNNAVSDYNARCGSFKYRESDLTLARDQVEARRSEFEAEGRELVEQP